MNEGKPVGIWIRVSTEDQVKGESPEHHEKRARYYAESKGWRVIEVYCLDAVSGKSVMQRPETQRMLHDMKTGRITGLIFSKLARLARNTRELLEFAEIFGEYNADLISLQESIDTSTPAGRLFYTMIAAMAQWEREEIADRVAASVPIRAKLGKPLGGQAPFGYAWEGNTLAPHSNEAPVRKLLYELFLEHRRKKTVARILNERGYRTRNGSPFSDTTIDRLLRDPMAKGLRRANHTKSLGDGKKWVAKPREDWVIVPVPAIVSAELWDQCNYILDEQRDKRKRVARKPRSLFTGFVYCETCDRKMYVPSNSPKYTCQSCRNKIGVTDLEEVFHSQIEGFFASPTEINGYLSEAERMIQDKEGLLKALHEEHQKLVAEADKVYRAYIDGGLDVKAFGSRYRPLEERIDQIENELPDIQGEVDFLKIQYLSSDQVFNEARDLASRWTEFLPDEKRRIVESITDRILIGKEDISIHLAYLPTPPNSPEFTTTWQRNHRVALPCCEVRLKSRKPLSPLYPKKLKTWGERLRKRRLDLGLLQKEVAKIIGVTTDSVCYWENNRAEPEIRYLPKIIAFLGYAPEMEAQTPGEQIVAARKLRGMSQKELARELGVDPGTLGRWERDERRPGKKSEEILLKWL